MTLLKRHNPVLERSLRNYLKAGDTQGLRLFLEELSNQEFRTAGYLLSERLLLETTDGKDTFWHFFLELVPYNAKAYLGTFLKAAVTLYKEGKLQLDESALTQFSKTASPIDCRKLLRTFLPVLKFCMEVRQLMRLFSSDEIETQIAILMSAGTLPSYYEMFQQFKKLEHDSMMLRHYCILLMQRGDNLSYNMASIMQSYFGLGELPGTFSLRLRTYELSRLDGSYELFKKEILKR